MFYIKQENKNLTRKPEIQRHFTQHSFPNCQKPFIPRTQIGNNFRPQHSILHLIFITHSQQTITHIPDLSHRTIFTHKYRDKLTII